MAYSAIATKTNGDLIAAIEYRQIRDNWMAGVPDMFTQLGDMAAATGADAADVVSFDRSWLTLVADDAQATGMKWIEYGIYNTLDTGTYPSAPYYTYYSDAGVYVFFAGDSGSVDLTDIDPDNSHSPGVYYLGNPGLYYVYGRMPTLMDYGGSPDTTEIKAKNSSINFHTTAELVYHIAKSPPEMGIFFGARIVQLTDTRYLWESAVPVPSDAGASFYSELTYSRQYSLVKMHGGTA